jgi:hypothetical protein
MVLEIQVLSWDRHINVAGLNVLWLLIDRRSMVAMERK